MSPLPPLELGLEGVRVEPQPLFGDRSGGVLHVLSGGENNPQWFGGGVKDIYACFGTPGAAARGGHVHRTLDEMFLTVSGTALWVLHDLRPSSPTYGKTAACVLGWDEPGDARGIPCHTFEGRGTLGRLRVPAGVYHTVCSVGKPFLSVALGTTGHDASDYEYPDTTSLPGVGEMLQKFSVPVPPAKT